MQISKCLNSAIWYSTEEIFIIKESALIMQNLCKCVCFSLSVCGYFITHRTYDIDSKSVIAHSIIIVKCLPMKPENQITKNTISNKICCII